MSKRTQKMRQTAEQKINRKDKEIIQSNEEVEELKKQYEELKISNRDKKVIDEYLVCKDSRADKMGQKLYERGMKDVKRRIRIRKFLRRSTVLLAILAFVILDHEKTWEKLEKLLKCTVDVQEAEAPEI